MPEPPMQAPSDAPTPEEVRRPFHNLYLLSLPAVLLAQFPDVDHLDLVQMSSNMRDAPVQRVYKLHAVASALVRKPALAEGRPDASLLASAIMTDDTDRDVVEQGLIAFANQQQQEADQQDAGRLTPERWHQFLRSIGLDAEEEEEEEEEEEPEQALGATRLISMPGCNDGETVGTDDGDAAVIISRFWTTYEFDAMAKFVEPTKWKEYGAPFWSDVLQVGERTMPTSNPLDYDATFDEIVNLPLTTLRVRLDVKYRVQGNLVRLDYDLSPVDPYGQVTFDSGFLAVTTDTYGDHGERTLVEGAKAIRFTDPRLNRLPDLACDGGWVYMMINMALNGAGVTSTLQPSAAVAQPDPPGFGPITAMIEEEIDAWIKLASKTLANHGATAKSVTRRVLAPQHDPRWINDLVGMADGAVAMTGATLGAWRRILRRLGNLEGH